MQAITNCIDEQNVNKDNIGAIFTTYRLLASDEERPLPVTLDSTYINQLHSELETDGRNIKESGYYDIVAMQLAHGFGFPCLNATAVLGIRQGTPASLWILLISIVLFFAIHAE